MIYIIISLIVLIAIAVVVIRRQNKVTPEQEPTAVDSDCCGAHAVCEKDSLLSSPADVTYFDDEELDQLANRPSETFSDKEIEMIEEVFYSLADNDVAPWIRSIQMRCIDLPAHIKEQALLIISERREHTAALYSETHQQTTN